MGGEQLIHGHPIEVLPANPYRYVAVTVLIWLCAAALMVVVRRFAGALTHPLEPVGLLTAGIIVVAVAAAIRIGWFFPPAAGGSGRLDQTVMLSTSLAVLAIGASLSLRNTPAVGMIVLVAPLAIEEIWAWAWYTRRCFGAMPPQVAHADPALATLPRAGRGGTTSQAVLAPDPEAAVFPEDILQQLTRCRAADGTEELTGWLRLAFAAGQRTGSIHVAFCPPFGLTPELAVEQLDGPDTRIKTAQLLPYGARLDLKLAAAADEATSVLLQFSARTQGE